MTRILVTGGTGFIGSHLVSGLTKSEENEVIVYSTRKPGKQQLSSGTKYILGNISDSSLITQTLKAHDIEVVYHLAWNSIHETSLENTAADLEANLLGTVNLLEACRKNGVRRVIFMSSGGTVYGLPDTLPISESQATHPISAYGVTKLAAEKYLGLFQHLYGLEGVIIRPSVPYGPGQDPAQRQGAIAVFIDRVLRSEPITIWGDGSSLRDYFYVGDMVDPLINAISIPADVNNIFNLGGGKAYTLRDLISNIEHTLNLKASVTFEPARNFDVPELILDCRRAKSKIGWQPNTGLEEGILLTEQWIRNRLG